MTALLDVRRRPGRLPFTRRPTAGRHRRGPATEPERREPDGRRRVWDGTQRARAEQLGLLEPGWLVIYGPYSRRFYAIARIAEVSEPLLDAATSEELRSLMRRSEITSLVPPPRSRESGQTRRTGRGGTHVGWRS
ncbi:hypothetical protein DQ384_35745 [Sphaerisporangium album]|uniref:Uncharacterized protein n=1 Tax=Sphaerisporangium album TaxID=509200 RepID=A0A367EXP0_9ACTN|nr:hypothetical protein [Sphaerisporangium album]RCG22459.1 hypothetical protein DQ384_35745 [Sphaerisporangium album]